MAVLAKPTWGLSGNQLKLLGLLTMTADHVGMILLPSWVFLRWIGRIAMPVFAWMIAEGCRHTRSRSRYLLGILILAAVCQTVMCVATGSFYQGILVVFSLSIGVIYLLDGLREKIWGKWVVPWLLLGLFVLTELLPGHVPLWDFAFDYGFCGMILPVVFYLGKDKKQRLLAGLAVLVLLSVRDGADQWFCLLSLPLLWLYSGQRGKYRLKYLFYIYYPAHLAAIYALTLWI